MNRSLLIFLTILLFVPVDAHSCSCVHVARNADIALASSERASLVLLGRVQELVTREWWEDGRKLYDVTVTVSPVELFKGETDKTYTLSPGPGSCMMNFMAGNIYLIFAYPSTHGDGTLMTSLCSSALYKYDPPGAGYENASLRARYEPVIEALRKRYR